jgi:hypothetical protein
VAPTKKIGHLADNQRRYDKADVRPPENRNASRVIAVCNINRRIERTRVNDGGASGQWLSSWGTGR